MNSERHVYVTYIRTTPEKLWHALTDADFTMRHWDRRHVSDWKIGSRHVLNAIRGVSRHGRR